VDDFDDLDALFADLDRGDLAGDVGDVDADEDAVSDLDRADWDAIVAPYLADGSLPPEVWESLWSAIEAWDDTDFDVIADYDVDAGEGDYL
jgi:hypothetical protein